MSYQFSCGFDDFTTASQKWDTVGAGAVTINSASARFGGTHSQGASFAQNATLTKNMVGNQVTLIVGMAIRWTAFPASSLEHVIDFLNAGTVQTSLGISSTGTLQFFQGVPASAVPRGSAGSTLFTIGVWHYLEALVTFSTTTSGVVQCWLDGVQVINSSSVQTVAANNFANQVKVGDNGNLLAGMLIDDLYILDGVAGGLGNTALGDLRIYTIMPNGAGSFAQFTPSGVANNWDAVNDIPPNDGTDYVADATINDRDSYAFEDPAYNGNAFAVVPWARISKDDAGAHTVELSMTDTANDGFSSAIAVPSSYAYINGGAFTVSPNGSAALSAAVVSRSEFGIKIIS